MLMTLVYYVVVVILIIIVYNYFNSNSSRIVEKIERKDMLVGSRNASQYKLYSGDNLPISKFSNSYTISFWVYINDYKYSLKENKYIMMKGNKDEDNDNPIIYLTPYQNNLVVRVKLQSQEDPTKFNDDELKNKVDDNVNQTLKEDSSKPELNNNNSGNNNSGNNNSGNNNSTNNNSGNNNSGNNQESANTNENSNTSQFMNVSSTESEESKELFGNISDNKAPFASVSYNESFYQEIDGKNIKETFEDHSSDNENINNTTTSNEDNEMTQNNDKSGESFGSEDKYDECMIQNVPLQKWVHVAIGFYNNVVDIYQDGKLKSSCVLRGFPEPPTGEIHLTPFGGFNGKVASVSGFNKSISQDMAYQIYREGPSKTSLYSFFTNLITFS